MRKLKNIFTYFFDWKYDRLWASRTEKERKMDFAMIFEPILLVAITVLTVFFFRKSGFVFNLVDLFLLIFCLRGGIYMLAEIKFHEDGVAKKKKTVEGLYKYEKEFYEYENRRLKFQKFFAVVLLIIALDIVVCYAVYAFNIIRLGYFKWSIIGPK